jgi:hypothetical protein
MLEARIGELKRDHVRAETHPPGGGIGSPAVSHPKVISLLVPQAITRRFEHEIVRQFSYCIDATFAPEASGTQP